MHRPVLLSVFILISALFFTTAHAEDTNERHIQTLIPTGPGILTTFGALTCSSGAAGDRLGLFTGGQAGLIIRDSIAAGVDASVLSAPAKNSSGYKMKLSYGGGLLEYHFAPASLIHISIGTMIGEGTADFSRDNARSETDYFLVIEPQIMACMNLTKTCRIGAGIGNRFSYGLNSCGFSDNDFRSAMFKVIIAFGNF